MGSLEMDLFAFIHDGSTVKMSRVSMTEGEGKTSRTPSLYKVFNLRRGYDSYELPQPALKVPGVVVFLLRMWTAKGPNANARKRPAVTDVSGSSHHPKKLKGDHGTSSGVATGGKSQSVIKELWASSIMNAEAGVTSVATLTFITSSISATPEREGGDPTDSVTGPNLRTVGPAERFFISSNSSHHSSTNASGAEVDSIIMSAVLPPVRPEAALGYFHAVSVPSIPVSDTETKITYPVRPFVFQDSGSKETVRPNVAGPSYYAKQDLSMGSRELNTETLHQVFVSQWNVLNDSLLDDSDVSREFVDHLAPPAFERKRLESKCEKQADLLKARDGEIKNLKAQLLLKEAEATEAVHLHI
ncbi:hypothetical protein Tco_0153559 [Tanacetum coccineum]